MLLFFKSVFSFISPYINKLKKGLLFIFIIYSAIYLFVNFATKEKEASKIDVANQITVAEQTELIAKAIESEGTKDAKYRSLFYRGMHCFLIGYACGNDSTEDGGGVLGKSMKFVSMPYANPIASGYEYIKNGAASVGLIPQANAWEGVGFSSLKGYIEIWTLFRNMAFLLLTVLIIVVGFMIMFRINAGQAEIKIESALPRIVLVMFLITFSFALAGFFIDIMYASIALIIGVFKDIGTDSLTGGWFGENDTSYFRFIGSGFLEILPLGGRLLGSSFTVGNDLWNMVPGVITKILAPGITLAAIIGSKAGILPVEGFVSSFTDIGIGGEFATFGGSFNWGGLPYWISNLVWLSLLLYLSNFLPGLILGGIIALTMLIFMFRMMFIFLESYVKILLYTIFSPVILLFGIIPGNGAISWWAKSMLGELSVFPTFIAISITSAAIIEVNTRGFSLGWGSLGYLADQVQTGGVGQFNLPYISEGFRPDAFNNVVSLGLLLMTPDLIKMVKGMFGVEGKGVNFSPMLFFGSFAAMSGIMGGVNSLGASIMGQTRWEEARGKFYDKAGRGFRATTGEIGERVRKATGRVDERTVSDEQSRRDRGLLRRGLNLPGTLARATASRIPGVRNLVSDPATGRIGFVSAVRNRMTADRAEEARRDTAERDRREIERQERENRIRRANREINTLNNNFNRSGIRIERDPTTTHNLHDNSAEASYDEIKSIMGTVNYQDLAAKNVAEILQKAINEFGWSNDPSAESSNKARIQNAIDFARLNVARQTLGNAPIYTPGARTEPNRVTPPGTPAAPPTGSGSTGTPPAGGSTP